MTTSPSSMIQRIETEGGGHRYELDGKHVLGVSEILQISGITDYGTIPGHILAKAAERGKLVHEATEAMDTEQKDFDFGEWPEAIHGYIRGYQAFLEATKFHVEQCEFVTYNQLHAYATTIDRTGTVMGKKKKPVPILLELKCTARLMPWTRIQLSAQSLCLSDHETRVRAALQLKKDGTYKVERYEDDYRDKLTWLQAVGITHWKLENGLAKVPA